MGLFEGQVALKPDHYPWAKEFINTFWHAFWTPDEFNFKSDLSQFKTELNPEEQQVIVRTLSAIAQIEIAVKSFWGKLGENLPHPSISDLGFVLANTEVIHGMAYRKLLDVLGLDAIFEENLKEDVVRGRVDYLRKYLRKVYKDDRKQYVYALILFSIFVENVSLFSQFYIIQHFNRFKNVLKDTSNQVNYTQLEEKQHFQVGVKIINTLREEYPELFDTDLECRILEEVAASIDAEGKIVDWILGSYDVPHLNARIVKAYITNRMNDSLEAVGFERVLTTDKEALDEAFWFIEEENANKKVDFFHKRPTDYAKNNKTYSVDELF